MYRDPLSDYLRDAYDPESPEARASAERARIAQRSERLEALRQAGSDTRTYNRLIASFCQDDPAFFTLRQRAS